MVDVSSLYGCRILQKQGHEKVLGIGSDDDTGRQREQLAFGGSHKNAN